MSVKLSVIIPCFNHGKYIVEAIESVLKYPRLDEVEIIVVNDGSTEKLTIDVLKGIDHPKVRVIWQENQGLAKARNNGIISAQGAYVLPLDSDNYINPKYIEEAILVFNQHPEVGVVYSDRIIFNDNDSKMKYRSAPDYNLKYILLGSTIDACAVFKKDVWSLLSGYDEGMPIMGLEDWDFWIRCGEHNIKFHHINKGLFYYRDLPDSMIKDVKLKFEIATEYIVKKHSHLYARFLLDIGRELDYSRRKPLRHFLKKLFHI